MTEYCCLLRMDEKSFNFLLEVLRLDITFKNTNCLKEVTPEQRLSTFLHFMATGKLLKLRAEMAFVSGNGSNDKQKNSPNISFLAFLYGDECIKLNPLTNVLHGV